MLRKNWPRLAINSYDKTIQRRLVSPARVPGRNAPLTRFLISAIYIQGGSKKAVVL